MKTTLILLSLAWLASLAPADSRQLPPVSASGASALGTPLSPPAATEKESAWGKAQAGVQVRLRAEKRTWQAGQTPTFRADIRNLGNNEYTVVQAQQGCGLEVDDTRYRWAGNVGVKSSPLPPGRIYENIVIGLTTNTWFAASALPETRRIPLRLIPGKHTLRVICFCEGNSALRSIGPESNAVEFEITP